MSMPAPTPTVTNTMEAVAGATDILGVALPAWLGAVGSILAGLVGLIALILSLRNRGGISTLTQAVQENQGVALDVRVLPGADPVRWVAWMESKGKYKMRNDARATVAELLSFTDVTPEGDNAAGTAMHFPAFIAGGESFPFIIEKSLVSPAVTAVKLVWREGEVERSQTVYI